MLGGVLCSDPPASRPRDAFLQLGCWMLTAVKWVHLQELPSGQESCLTQSHTSFPGDRLYTMTGQLGVQSLISSPLFRTTLKGHPSSKAPRRSWEALVVTTSQFSPYFSHSCFPSSLKDVNPKGTPPETTCTQISISDPISRQPNPRQKVWSSSNITLPFTDEETKANRGIGCT